MNKEDHIRFYIWNCKSGTSVMIQTELDSIAYRQVLQADGGCIMKICYVLKVVIPLSPQHKMKNESDRARFFVYRYIDITFLCIYTIFFVLLQRF